MKFFNRPQSNCSLSSGDPFYSVLYLAFHMDGSRGKTEGEKEGQKPEGAKAWEK